MRAPEFEASISEAKLYPEFWRILLGALLIVFIYVASIPVFLGIALGIVSAVDQFALAPLGREWQLFAQGQIEAPLNKPLSVVLLLTTFIGMFLGPILAAAAIHFRGPSSLFGTFSEWIRGFSVGLAVVFVVYTPFVILSSLIDPPEVNLAFDTFLRWLPLALILLFVQTGAEELLFRGYLQQQLAARFTARWIWFWIPAVLFSLAHYNPDFGPNVALVLLATLVFGFVAADLTEQTGSLGAAMGLHFANNFFGLLIVSIKGTITGLALYVSPEPVEAIGMQTVGLAVGILVLLFVWWIVRKILLA
ncbi:MAG: CPBP family intramembrane glutamic endopeptidase [Pseudomonadota bacterium]